MRRILSNTDLTSVLFAVFLMVTLALCGCSPQERLNRKLKRAERFAKKHGLTINDTIKVVDVDTFIVESKVHDTTTLLVLHDSVTVINNHDVMLKYVYVPETKEIHHFVECKGDTIVKVEHHDVVTEKIIHQPMLQKRYRWILNAVLFILGVVLSVMIFQWIKSLLFKS